MKDEKSIKSYEFSTIEDYFSKYIDIIMATRIPDENKLTIREKEFLYRVWYVNIRRSVSYQIGERNL